MEQSPKKRVSLPRWREDFPIDVAADQLVARREFSRFLVLTSFAFVVGQVWIGVQNALRKRRGEPPIAPIAGAEELAVGAALAFHYPTENDDCVLVRTGEQEYVAYSASCTHLACGVVPEPEKNRFNCPCHRGFFDLKTGNPTAGPPRRPLSRIRLEQRQGRFYATGVELRAS